VVLTIYSLENCYWVTKMSLRRWSAVAKQSFERLAQHSGICVTQDGTPESMHFICLKYSVVSVPVLQVIVNSSVLFYLLRPRVHARSCEQLLHVNYGLL